MRRKLAQNKFIQVCCFSSLAILNIEKQVVDLLKNDYWKINDLKDEKIV